MKYSYLLISVLLLLVLAACTPINNPGSGTYDENRVFDPDQDLEAMTFSSVQELGSFLKSNSGDVYQGGIAFTRSGMTENIAFQEEGSSDEGVKIDYSETNNQVWGVDEADIIKTDGEYIYTITDKTLFIVKAYPGEDAEVITRIELDSNPSGMFIDGDRLAVFGNYYNNVFLEQQGLNPRIDMSFFNVYDIEDKEDVVLESEFKFEGRYSEARLIDGKVYLVLLSQPDPYFGIPTPMIMEGTLRSNIPAERIYHYPVPYNSPQFATIHSLDIGSGELLDSKSITVDYGSKLYMSENNIYLAYGENINQYKLRQDIIMDLVEPMLTDSDKQLIEKIKETDDDVLSQQEKQQKIFSIMNSYLRYMDYEELDEFEEKVDSRLSEKLEEYEYLEFTIIHKLQVEDGHIIVSESGKAPGSLNNQFSMDEYEGVLRVATTVNGVWNWKDSSSTESTNHVLTFDQNMDILDHLQDLAEGERIYSTRFVGEKLFMVTFRQIDPFFVIDLSDPEKIESLGELKIPGFSRYLHPYDKNTIIGVGRDATEMGRAQGLKISLFDVSNPENPVEIAKFEAKGRYSSSIAEYEHKAFLFSKEKNLLVIPAYNYDYDNGDGYNGALVFNISKDNIELRALIDHSTSQSNRYSPSVERSLYIEDLLYTKSPYLLRINDLVDELAPINNVRLNPFNEGDMPIIEFKIET